MFFAEDRLPFMQAMLMARDDYTKFNAHYENLKTFKTDPFGSLHQEGVGKLIVMAIELGICGEHGGDPDSVAFCYRVGMNYASCSPYRVPIARLAAAQATIAKGSKTESRTA